jgi:AsmA protein
MRRALLVLGAVVILLAGTAVAAVVFFPKDLVAAELKKQVLASTGRTLTFDANPGMTFWPALGLEARNVALSNPHGFDGQFLTARKIVFAVSAAPLLRGDVEVTRLFLDAPKLTLAARKDAEPNWTFPAAKKDAANEQKLKSLRLDDVSIADGALTYIGEDGGAPLEFSNIDAAVALASLDTPATIKGSLVYRTRAVDIDAVVGAPRALLDQGATPLSLSLKAEHLESTLEGNVDTATGAVAGKLAAKGASVRGLLDWLGSPLPPGAGFGPYNVTADLDARLPRIAFGAGVFRLDAIAARGNIAVTLAESGRMAVSGALSIPALDVNPYMPAPPAATPAQASGVNTTAAWDAKPMDLAGLRAIDADLNLGVGDLRFQKMQFTQGQLRLKLTNGVVDAALSRVSLYGGAGTARLVVDASGATPAIRSEMDVRDVQALPLLTAAIGFDKIEGRGRLVAKLAGSGRSQADIMRALDGTLTFAFNDGAWRGVNLAQVARQVQAVLAGETVGSAAKTDFAEFAADFTVANGVGTTQNLRLLNPFVRLDGKGDLDIGGQALDIRLSPRAVRSIEGQGGDALARGIGVPFRATGPWTGVKFRVDREAVGNAVVNEALGGRSVGEALGGLVNRATKQKDETSPLDRLIPRK